MIWGLALLLAALLILPVFATGTPTMTISAPQNATPGSTVTVTVSISQLENCTAIGLGLQFDTEVFEMVEGSFELLIEDSKQASFKYVTNAKGYVANIQRDGSEPVSGDVFRFDLKVKESAPLNGNYTITGTPSIRVNNALASCQLESATLTIACSHSYGGWEKLDGEQHQRKCGLCGAVEKATHNWDGGSVTQEPTCTTEGVKTFVCADCGQTRTESVEKIPHSYDDGAVTTQPTCTAEGVKTFTCGCGHTKTESVKALGHDYDDGVITTEPTCDADGVKTYTCKRSGCGHTKTEPVAMQGHDYDDGVVTKEPTCEEAGVRTYTCTQEGCDVTRTETIEKLGHAPKAAVEENRKEATCAAAGSYDTVVYCDRCSKELERTNHAIAILPHSYDGGKVTTQPTCTAEGVKTFTCTGCGDSYTESVAMTEHIYDSGKVTTQPTCTAEGIKTFTCGGCGKTYTESVAMIDHSFDNACDSQCNGCDLTRETSHVYSDTYSTNSVTHWYPCTVCGDRHDEYPHTPGPEATEWDPQVCTVCDYVIQPALGHTHRFADTYTWDEEAHWYACSGCPEVDARQSHVFDNDCDTTCDTCGYTRETEHNYSERLSFDATGHWHACENCGDVMELLPHTPGPEATADTDQICLDCGFILQIAGVHEHTPTGDWHSNEDGHWHQCACGELLEKADHAWNEGVKDEQAGTVTYHCTVCGHPKTEQIPAQPQPGEPQQTQPGPVAPQPPKPDAEEFPWWILILVFCGLLLAGVVFVIVGILVSRKQVGKFSRK